MNYVKAAFAKYEGAMVGEPEELRGPNETRDGAVFKGEMKSAEDADRAVAEQKYVPVICMLPPEPPEEEEQGQQSFGSAGSFGRNSSFGRSSSFGRRNSSFSGGVNRLKRASTAVSFVKRAASLGAQGAREKAGDHRVDVRGLVQDRIDRIANRHLDLVPLG